MVPFMVRTQVSFHSALDMSVDLSQSDMQSTSVGPPPPNAISCVPGADPPDESSMTLVSVGVEGGASGGTNGLPAVVEPAADAGVLIGAGSCGRGGGAGGRPDKLRIASRASCSCRAELDADELGGDFAVWATGLVAECRPSWLVPGWGNEGMLVPTREVEGIAEGWDGASAMGAALIGAAAREANPDECAAAVSASERLAAARTPIANRA